MKKLSLLLFIIFAQAFSIFAQANDTQTFWDSLQNICGKAFAGEIIHAPKDDSFRGKKLVMHVRSCEENVIKIPFFVGEDRSRTWVLTKTKDGIQLKHDHRHKDGKPDEVTMYGGVTSNIGSTTRQVFPADDATVKMIPAAASNVWWIDVDKRSFTYNLRRVGTDRLFSIKFDLTKAIETPEAPWGWEDSDGRDNAKQIPITSKLKDAIELYKKGFKFEDRLEIDEAEKAYKEALKLDSYFALVRKRAKAKLM